MDNKDIEIRNYEKVGEIKPIEVGVTEIEKMMIPDE